MIRMYMTFVVLISFSAHAQHKDEVLQTNLYENLSKKSQGQMVDGRLQGAWTKWYPSGAKESSGDWINDKPEGHWEFWYESGEKKAEGQFREGQQVGVWTFWDKDGNFKTRDFSAATERLSNKSNKSSDNKTNKKFQWKSASIDGAYIYQDSGGSISTARFYWSPRYSWGTLWALQGLIGAFPVKLYAENTTKTATDFEILFSYGPMTSKEIWVEFGAGLQNWNTSSGTNPVVTLDFATEQFKTWLLSRIYMGMTYGKFPNNDKTFEPHLGARFIF